MSNILNNYGDGVNSFPPQTFPAPGARISAVTPIDSYGERYRVIVEFDPSNEEAVTYLATTPFEQGGFADAWDAYVGEPWPGYSPENAVKLLEAIKFYLYITEDEAVNLDTAYDGPGYREDPEAIRSEQPRRAPWPGPLKHPNAMHDQGLVDRALQDNRDPFELLAPFGDRMLSDKYANNPHALQALSSHQLGLSEYESVLTSPRSPYDYGGPYATGANRF